MDYEHLRISSRDEVMVATIDRPPANAMSLQLLAEGRDLVERIRDELPKAVVLTGAGDFFSGGVDLKLAPRFSAQEQEQMVAGINALFSAWYSLWLPVVAAVNGHAVAGGMILALCGDHRVGAESARYGLTEVRVGVPYPAAAIGVVRAELGPGPARRSVLGAELIDAPQALALGMLDELLPADQVLARGLEVASGLAELPRDVYAESKRQLRGRTAAEIDSAIAADPIASGWLGQSSSSA
jgi:enoyl-CoA hydratase